MIYYIYDIRTGCWQHVLADEMGEYDRYMADTAARLAYRKA